MAAVRHYEDSSWNVRREFNGEERQRKKEAEAKKVVCFTQTSVASGGVMPKHFNFVQVIPFTTEFTFSH